VGEAPDSVDRGAHVRVAGTCRRRTKDREKSVMSSEAFVKLAMIHLMLNRSNPNAPILSSNTTKPPDDPLWDST